MTNIWSLQEGREMLSGFLEMGSVVVTEVGFYIFCLTLDCCGQTSHLTMLFSSERERGKKTPERNLVQVCTNTILGG